MKKKLLVLVALLLCLVTVLAACGDTVKFRKVVAKDYVDQNPTLTTAGVVNVTGTYSAKQADLILFSGSNGEGKNVKTVFNIAQNKTVWTQTETDTVSYTVTLKGAGYADVAWFQVGVATKAADGTIATTTEIYDQNGNQLLTTGGKTSVQGVLDLIAVDGNVYRIGEDGSIAKAFEISALRELPQLYAKVDETYFAVNYDGSGTSTPTNFTLSAYDDELNPVYTYAVPSYVSFMDVNVAYLNNGNVLIQYTLTEPATAEDWTYVDAQGNKITLVSKLINARNGKIKDLELDFIIAYGFARDSIGSIVSVGAGVDWDTLNKRIDNIALVNYIVDGRLSTASADSHWIQLSNKGKDKGMLDGTLTAQAGLPKPVCEDRWIINTHAGEAYVVNQKGKVIAEISGADGANSAYIRADGKLFDYDAEVAFDYKTKDYTYKASTNRAVLFTNKDGELILYANGAEKTLIAKDAQRTILDLLDEDVKSDYFIIKDSTDAANVKYEIYNDAGTLIHTIQNASGTVEATYTAASSNAKLLVGMQSNGNDVVVRIG